jgi:hypothetical protein
MEQSDSDTDTNSAGKIDPDDFVHDDPEDIQNETITFVKKLSGEELLNVVKFDYNKKFDKTKNVREQASEMLKEIREQDLPFPLIRYSHSKDFIFKARDRLIKYKAEWIERSHSEIKGHQGTWWLPSMFRGKPLQFVTQHNDWWKIDVVIDYFTEYERIRAKKAYDNSMESDWYNDDKLLKAIVNCSNRGEVNAINLRDSMFYIGRELSLFRVTKTKSFLEKIFYPNNNDFSKLRWLDISAGWGDRIFTACTLKMDYLGFDPNLELKPGHDEIVALIGEPERQKIIYEPFEKSERIIQDDVAKNGLFDICLCCPPFFDIELYNGPNQSITSYPRFNDWLVKFLFKSINIVWNNLKVNGYFAINIANIKNCDMVSPMQLFIEDMLECASWEGIIMFSGRGTQTAPGALYVWKKVDAKTPLVRWNPSVKRSFKSIFPELYQKWLNETI